MLHPPELTTLVRLLFAWLCLVLLTPHLLLKFSTFVAVVNDARRSFVGFVVVTFTYRLRTADFTNKSRAPLSRTLALPKDGEVNIALE